MSQSAIGKVARRSLLYFGLALAGLAIIGLLLAISIHTGMALTVGWIGLTGYTSLLLWVAIGKSREHWHRPMFWLTIVSLLGVHLLVFIAVLRSYPQWRMIWFLPIVVVEAVEHHIEEGMTPKEASLKAMEEISGPVVGIALVLSAVVADMLGPRVSKPAS